MADTRSKPQTMYGDEVLAAINAAGLTQQGMARLLGVGGKTIRDWRGRGVSGLPVFVLRLVAALVAAGWSPEEIARAGKKPVDK